MSGSTRYCESCESTVTTTATNCPDCGGRLSTDPMSFVYRSTDDDPNDEREPALGDDTAGHDDTRTGQRSESTVARILHSLLPGS